MNLFKLYFLSLTAMMLTLSVSASAQTEADSLAFVNAQWNWHKDTLGIETGAARIEMFNSVQNISVVRYPANKFRTGLVHSPGKDAATVDVLASESGALAALNGSYFNMKNRMPVTFFSLDHEVVGTTTPDEIFRTDGIIAFRDKKGRKMEIFLCDTLKYGEYNKKYKSAIASGPVLVVDGNTRSFPDGDSFFGKRHPRTVIGTDSKGNYYFIVIDGRFRGFGEGTTIKETAAIARYFGLTAAVNLDGGGSSTVWTRECGVINHPSDNKKFDHEGCRTVPNIFAVWK